MTDPLAGIPRVMGILNVTPDSFSDGGRYADPDAAVVWARRLVAAGAAFVDVGGESTRPGADPVTESEELRRVVPVIEAIRSDVEGAGARVSVDTRRPAVARAAVAAGATIVNDVSASLWPIAAELGVGWVAMHMQGQPGTMQRAPRYDDVVAQVFDFLLGRAAEARSAGVAEIWVDPGFGFGKSPGHNLALVAAIAQLVEGAADRGAAVLLGCSRKQTLGLLTAASDAVAAGREPAEAETTLASDRTEMSVAVATWAMMAGVQVIRAHDVGVHAEAAAAVAALRNDTWQQKESGPRASSHGTSAG